MAIRCWKRVTCPPLIGGLEDPIWSGVDLEYRLLAFINALQRNSIQNFGVRAEVGMRPGDFPPKAGGENWVRLYRRALTEGPVRTEFNSASGRLLELSFNLIMVDGRAPGDPPSSAKTLQSAAGPRPQSRPRRSAIAISSTAPSRECFKPRWWTTTGR